MSPKDKVSALMKLLFRWREAMLEEVIKAGQMQKQNKGARE